VKFWLRPMVGVLIFLTNMCQTGGVKPAAPGVFLVQSGRFFLVQKFKYLNVGSNI